MRSLSDVAFARRQDAKFDFAAPRTSTLKEAFFGPLARFVDASDPDVDTPQVLHAIQSAEAARAAGEPDWLVFTALVHDVGKVMAVHPLGGRDDEGMSPRADGPQWALGGDTWVVGCPLPASAVFPELNSLSPDARERHAAPTGVYAPGCGLAALEFCWGHDSYGHKWAIANRIPLPAVALEMIRLHSCYPLHSSGAYAELLAPGDVETLEAVRRFNKYDLYSKATKKPDVEALWESYYGALVDKFAPGPLLW